MQLHDSLMWLGFEQGVEPFRASDIDSVRRTLDRYGIGRVLFADIPDEAKRPILVANPGRILAARLA